MTKKHFPLEKILTISVTDYLSLEGKKGTDYEAVGVHVGGVKNWDSCGKYEGGPFLPLEAFYKLVPKNAEVVVAYRSSVGGNEQGGNGNPITILFEASGTALIPKKNK